MTFFTILDALTQAQRAALREVDISDQMRSDWKHGRRLPTEPQIVLFAAITQTERHTLQDELAVLKAPPKLRKAVEKALGHARTAAAAMLASFLVLASGSGVATQDAKAFSARLRRRRQ